MSNTTTTKDDGKPFDLLGNIMAWEGGELSEEDTIVFFQHLIDTGDAWTLQGCYGRQAHALIQAGLCHLPEHKSTK